MMRRWDLAAMTLVLALGAGVAAHCPAQEKTERPALLVLSKDANELEIVDPGTLKIVGRATTGPVPHEVAVSDDGKIAVATNYGPHMDGTSLSVIDLDAQKEIHRVELTNLKGPAGQDFGSLTGPHGVEFFAGRFYFTAEGAKKIARYDLATNRVNWEHALGQSRTHMLVIAKTTFTIYTANVNSDSVTVVAAPATDTVIATGKGPEGIDVSPDEKEVWAANSGDGTVSVIDTATKKVVATLNVGTKHSNRVKFTPDGKRVLISDLGTGDLLVMDAKSRQLVKTLSMGKNAEGILIPPDGALAFVAASGDDKVKIVDLKTLAVTGEIDGIRDPDGMAWRK